MLYFKKIIAVSLMVVLCSWCVIPICSAASYNAAVYDVTSQATIEIENNVLKIVNTIQLDDNQLLDEHIFLLPNGQDTSAQQLLQKIQSKEIVINRNNTSFTYGDSSTRGDLQYYISGRDSTQAVLGWVRVYYYTGYSSGKSTIRATQCEGGFSNLDSSVRVIAQEVIFGNNGVNSNGLVNNQRLIFDTTSRNWTQNAPTSWAAVYDDTRALVGAACTFTLQRIRGSTHTWDFTVNCMIRGTEFSVT